MQTTTLYCQTAGSDKVYQASIAPREAGFVVEFAYGRRGTTLQTGFKNNVPVSLEKANAIFDRLIRSKLAKGYTPGADATLYRNSTGSPAPNSILPQLLNPVAEERLPLLLDGRAYCLQAKHDGRRLLVTKSGDQVTGINRRGFLCGLPLALEQVLRLVPDEFVIDGEAVDDVLHVFDLLEWRGKEIRPLPYRERLRCLLDLLMDGPGFESPHIRWVETHVEPALKNSCFDRLKRIGAEGVVFKQLSAPYTPGRPSADGPQLKFKFVESASVIVRKINEKRSVAIALFDNGRLVPAGNVAIPMNQPVPEKGQVIEVRYLYAMRESGALIQPRSLGVRDDITPEECTRHQLKFRSQA